MPAIQYDEDASRRSARGGIHRVLSSLFSRPTAAVGVRYLGCAGLFVAFALFMRHIYAWRLQVTLGVLTGILIVVFCERWFASGRHRVFHPGILGPAWREPMSPWARPLNAVHSETAGLVFGGLLYAFVVYLLIRTIAAEVPWWFVQAPLLVAVLGCALVLLGATAIMERRSEEDDSSGSLAPHIWFEIQLLLVTLVFAFTVFGAVTYALVDHHVIAPIRVEGSNSPIATLDEDIALYAWHFLDTVPLVSITETLHWQEPVQHYDSSTGAMILVFKVLTLVSVTAALIRIVRRKTTPRPNEERSATGVEVDR